MTESVIINIRHRLSLKRRYMEMSVTLLMWLLFLGFWIN